MADLHMEALDTLEVAEAVDQGLASLNARLEDVAGEFPRLNMSEREKLVVAISRACRAWDEFADVLPGFREP